MPVHLIVRTEKLPIDQIPENASYNPRKIEPKRFAALKNMLRRNGQLYPLIANLRTKEKGWEEGSKPTIVSGHQRARAMRDLGFTEVEFSFIDVDAGTEKAINIALNNDGMEGEFTLDVKNLLDEIRRYDVALIDELRLFEAIGVDEAPLIPADKVIVANTHEDLELQPFEHYDYAFVICTDVRDWNWLTDFLQLKKVNASPVGAQKIGLMRGVKVNQLRQAIEREFEKRTGIKAEVIA